MGLRHRSIRLRVGILIVVPILCLIGLYGFAASITLGNALTQARAKSLRDQLLTPLTAFQAQLDKERHLAVLSLADPRSTQLASELSFQEGSTQAALTKLKQALAAPSVLADASTRERQLMSRLIAHTARLDSLRNDVQASAITIHRVLVGYSALVNDAYLILQAAIYQQVSVPLVTQALDVIGLDQVAQITVEESDLLDADIQRGQFPDADRTLFAQLAYTRATTLASTLALLNPPYSSVLSAAVKPALSTSMSKFENVVIAAPWRHGPPAQITSGDGVFMTYTGVLDSAIGKAATQLESQATSNANGIFVELFLAAGLGFLGILASIVLSLYIGRGLVQQLRSLRESALSLASDKLPSVIRQLREGQAVDLSEYIAPESSATSDEIEQVEQAFSVVQQTAVQSAVDEARLRRGISDVFRNLAGRSQSLLHRQLTLLDAMERRATEPEELEDLFRIDHLTTRMRRHAEGLIILSGETPARGWRQPVPLIDVLRAAVAEVEDYTRVRVLSRTRAAVAGHAVADVIHLIAELAENATVFSPPNTPVRIQGDIVGRGFAIEIEDRGLGISSERLAEINANLASPPQFDLSDSDRLGLFIAGQLARRHDIAVTLQTSVYGGTTAVVIIPRALVVDEDSLVLDPALQAAGPAGLPGRHAALAGAERARLTAGSLTAGSLTAGNGHAASIADASGPHVSPNATAADELPSGTLIPGSLPPDGLLLHRPGGEPSAGPLGRPDFELPRRQPVQDLQRHQGADDLPRRQPTEDLPRRQPTEEPAILRLQLQPQASAPAKPDLAPSDLAPSDLAPSDLAPSDLAPPDLDETGRGPDAGTSTAKLAGLALPTRVRQASLAPQLRAPQPARPADEPADTLNSPEAARNTMSALQRGWQLGRAEAGAQLPDPPADPRRSDYDVFARPSADSQGSDEPEDDNATDEP